MVIEGNLVDLLIGLFFLFTLHEIKLTAGYCQCQEDPFYGKLAHCDVSYNGEIMLPGGNGKVGNKKCV